MTISPRPEIRKIAEAVHGTVNDSELRDLGIDSRDIIDFSTNVNPFGPSPMVREALIDVPLNCYPDRESLLFRREVAKKLGISEDNAIAGNGASELLSLIAQAFIRSGDDVFVVGPTYSEYSRSAAVMGANVQIWDLTSEDEFVASLARLRKVIREMKPRALYLCNPNNPTGQFIQPQIIDALAGEFEEILFVVDEAFLEFIRNESSLVRFGRGNVVVLRSLTKAYGLAGLRLGYAVANPVVVRALCQVRVPWSVNAMAQAAGIVALRDHSHLEMSVRKLHENKQRLMSDLQLIGLNPQPSETTYFLVPISDAGRVRTQLLAEFGILVRDCASFGLRDAIRIGTRGSADNAKLVEALSALIGRGHIVDGLPH